MYHSLEVRVPLLDKNVIKIASQMDWRSCLDLQTSRGKIPLRSALGRYVKHQTMEKKGFTVPMRDWLTGPLQGLLQEKVLQQHTLLGQPLKRSALQRLYKRMLAGDTHIAWGLWSLLSLALWDEVHFANRS
jgi:asparagine synthase (glutamine-hydrolysing)